MPETVWEGRGELTEWPQRDWFVLLRRDGFQPIWDKPPRTSSMLWADAIRQRDGVAVDAEAWHDNALVRTTSAPRLMNADRLAQLIGRWSKPKPPEPPAAPKKRRERERPAATSDQLIAELKVYEAVSLDEDVRLCAMTNKIRHRSRLWALHHRNRLATLPDERFPERLEVYKCKGGCGDWHVGHKT
jgi:hypothetical protein